MNRLQPILFLLAPAVATFPSGAQAGELKGQVSFPPFAQAAGRHPPPIAYWRLENGKTPPLPEADARGEVVIVLDPQKKPPGEPTAAAIDAGPLHLSPRIAVSQVGAPVTVKNTDKVTRTLFLKDGDLFMPPEPTLPGGTREVKFREPGDYQICDADLPYAVTTLLVVVAPYSTRADDKGAFSFEVPDGKYTLRAWWRGGWTDPQAIEIGKSTKDVTVKLAAGRDDAAAARENKQ